MYDTGLYQRLGPGGLNRVGEATQTVAAHDQHVFEASVAYLGQYRQPIFGAFAAVAQPNPQDMFAAVHIDADHHICWAVDHGAVGSDLDHHGVYVQKGIAPIKGTVLPFGELVDDPVGDFRHQRR